MELKDAAWATFKCAVTTSLGNVKAKNCESAVEELTNAYK
jgi:hypothetical protein